MRERGEVRILGKGRGKGKEHGGGEKGRGKDSSPKQAR